MTSDPASQTELPSAAHVTPRRFRVVVADDHGIVRDGLRMLVESLPDFQCVGATGDGLEAIRLVAELAPDLLVLDLSLAGLSGFDVMRQIKRDHPATRTLVLTGRAGDGHVFLALGAGARGYVLKVATFEILVEAMRTVVAGRSYLCPPIAERAIGVSLASGFVLPGDPYARLTGREREVLQLAAAGHANAEIGRRLFISRRTVETHRANLIRKLDLGSHAALVQYALRRGLLPDRPDG